MASRKAVWHAKRLAKEQQRLESKIGEYLLLLDKLDADDGGAELNAEAVKAALTALESEQADNLQVQALLQATGRSQLTETEPDARPMKGHGPAYNVQSAVDEAHHLIAHHAVTDKVTDNRSLQPMAEGAKQALQASTLQVLADAGYADGQQVAALEEQAITPLCGVQPVSEQPGRRRIIPE